jgi:thiamine biosynthesis lipoprotein
MAEAAAVPPPSPAASHLVRSGPDCLFTFHAMATPCEVRLEGDDIALAGRVARVAEAEARRIEAKFSRYRPDSIVGRINAGAGGEMVVDAETARLLDFADECHDLSRGMFDITSGVLRRIWHFDGSNRLPSESQIKSIRPLIGWEKVRWHSPAIRMPAGMEIDLGGLAKEYAVDRTLAVIQEITSLPVLVNFGGDLRVSGPRGQGARWKVAIESVDGAGQLAGLIELATGALATSGDARRFLLKDGKRYGHILNPKTCRPVEQAPRSVTVAAATCIEAGMTATMAILQGRDAEAFLKREGVRAWCIR